MKVDKPQELGSGGLKIPNENNDNEYEKATIDEDPEIQEVEDEEVMDIGGYETGNEVETRTEKTQKRQANEALSGDEMPRKVQGTNQGHTRKVLEMIEGSNEKFAAIQKVVNSLLEKVNDLEEENIEMRKEIQELRTTNEKNTSTLRSNIDIINRRTQKTSEKLHESREKISEIETMGFKVQEINDKVESLNRIWNEYSGQQQKMNDSRLAVYERKCEDKVKFVEEIMKETEKGMNKLSRQIQVNTKLNERTQEQVKAAKTEARSAMSLTERVQKNAWTKVESSKVSLKQIREAQKEIKADEKKTTYIHIRVEDTTKQYDLREIGKKIDEKYGKGTVSYSARTKSGHIKTIVNKKEAAEKPEEWLNEINPEFSVLDTTPWYKGVVYRVPREMTTEEIREEIEDSNGIVLKRDPKIISQTGDSSTVMLYFENASEYIKCKQGGVIMRYQKLHMKAYYPRVRNYGESEYRPRQNNDNKLEGKDESPSGEKKNREENMEETTTNTSINHDY